MSKIQSVALFADCGVTPHQAIYRQAGASVAKHGARLICVARKGEWPRAIIDSAFAQGGAITVMCGPESAGLNVPQGVVLERYEDEASAARAAVEAARAVIGLPAGIDTVGMLYGAWREAGGAQSQRPLGLLNRDRAYEVVRGFVGDIAAAGRGNVDAVIQFSDSFEDLWTRLTRLV
ncbi:hypothetical protein [Pelagibacterium luteolum]|uniref:Uncharacterized protein n=1 Tax=Pelagibacterium luteolum TaxID=440168 RepID=A0A1G7TT42_9HYPH|nr:hypothetical protein [Pelagibacterium luteolum]SDG38371.1 hypothetical protein SAMN04487974_102321 [Pelagibacterium luteolum]